MMDATMQKIRAVELWRQGYNHHTRAFALAGGKCDREAVDELNTAVSLYSQSIETFPTAEAYTFRGWAFRSFGRIDDAIEECKRAIQVDPDFGNPYNDIGSYLIQLGRYDEAIPWLEQAIEAKRYEPRHFPYYNLGRAYLAKGSINRASELFKQSLEIEPRYTLARQGLENARRMVN